MLQAITKALEQVAPTLISLRPLITDLTLLCLVILLGFVLIKLLP